jgi:hypothetical protein
VGLSETEFLDYFQRTTVAVLRDGQTCGTGFFAAPGYVVTCAHVVDGIQGQVELRCEGTAAHGSIIVMGNPRSLLQIRPGDSPYPDVAIVSLNGDGHGTATETPAVFLDEETPRLDEPLYSFGHAQGEYAQNGESILLNYEGPANDLIGRKMLKLRQGNVRPGMSGAPVLNRRTGKVCGVLFSSLGVNSNLGGRAIPSSLLLPMSLELKQAHDTFHRINTKWSDLWNGTAGAVRLMDFPRGPVVERDRVSMALIKAVANLYPTPMKAPAIVGEANRLRRQADDGAGLIDFAEVPPSAAAPSEYWYGAFGAACLQGPRMLAALLLVMDEWQFAEPIQVERRKLLDYLRV